MWSWTAGSVHLVLFVIATCFFVSRFVLILLSFQVETVESVDFTLEEGDKPLLIVKTLELTVALGEFCIEHGIQVINKIHLRSFSI